jgi:hypothetical protein
LTASGGGTSYQIGVARVLENALDFIAAESSVIEPCAQNEKIQPGNRVLVAEGQNQDSAVEVVQDGVPTDALGLPLELSAPEEVAPAPTRADLLTDFLPIDRATLETAIDHILENFDDLVVGLADLKILEGLVCPVVGGAILLLGAEAVLRWRKRAAGVDKATDAAESNFHPLLGLTA